MTLIMLFRTGCAALLCLPLMVSGGSYTYIDVYVRGEIFIAPCKINQGDNILIDFKDVSTTRIDNDNYREKLDYRIACQDNRTRAMKLYITGTSSSVDSRYLSTSVSDLAVKFLADDKLMPLNEKITIQYPVQPDIMVVLAKKPAVKLPAGEFNATATIHIDYE
ncbi:TPA: fimbrial protein [Morganella morganii]|nr:fimbrial protein [Morganella morganii]